MTCVAYTRCTITKADSFISGELEKSKSAGIGGRVYAHRIEEQWDFDTYSWFEILPVSDEGVILHDAEMMSEDKLINNLEALLIYLLEPTWNGNYGTYRKIPRYRQVPV